VIRAFELDNRRRYLRLIEDAVKANVSVYPVSLSGVEGGTSDMFWEFANNTDGGVVATNDYRAGLRRVADDVSAYYVLTYTPANTTPDGTFRRIDVKVKQSGVRVHARRGYFAPEPRPEGTPAPVPPMSAGLDRALGALARLRPDARLFTRTVVEADAVAVAAELASASWAPKGAVVQATITAASGESTSGAGRIEAGLRGVALRLPRPGAPGPYRVSVRVEGGAERLLDEAEATSTADPMLGSPVVFRATPSARSPLMAVADMQFRRTERVHLEWAVGDGEAEFVGRLLGRDGRPLAVPVALSPRTEDGRRLLVADLNLAPLAAGDYVIAVTATAAGRTSESYVAIRVRN
jgi:hypothetical protein